MKKLLRALIFICVTPSLYSMESIQKVPESEASTLIKIQDVPQLQNIIVNGAGKIINGVEYLDISQNEPALFVTFQELMKEKACYMLPFILASVTTTFTSPKSAITTTTHSYYEATGLNKTLLGQIIHNDATGRTQYSTNKRVHEPDKFRDPFNKQSIQIINYFIINPHSSQATYIGNDMDLFSLEQGQSFLIKLFYILTLTNTILGLPENDPFKLQRLFAQLASLGVLYYNEQKYAQALTYLEQAAQQNDNLQAKAKALTYLGHLYFSQNQYLKAKHYLEQAALQNDNLFSKAGALSTLGKLYFIQNEYQKAIPYLKQPPCNMRIYLQTHGHLLS